MDIPAKYCRRDMSNDFLETIRFHTFSSEQKGNGAKSKNAAMDRVLLTQCNVRVPGETEYLPASDVLALVIVGVIVPVG